MHAAPELYIPAPQLVAVVHVEEPEVELVPTSQPTQLAEVMAPVVAKYVPAAQLTQAAWPDNDEYIPAAHGVQTVAPVDVWKAPALHCIGKLGVGLDVGCDVGLVVGLKVGLVVGLEVGLVVGLEIGCPVSPVVHVEEPEVELVPAAQPTQKEDADAPVVVE